MSPRLTVRTERLPLRAPFRISRGVKTHADVVVAALADGAALGRGECVPYARYGESVDSVAAELTAAGQRIADGAPVEAVLAAMAPGAARNALDCARWDLAARIGAGAVAARLGRSLPPSLPTAITISLDTPEAMRAAAAAVADAPLLKVKLDAERPADCLRAVSAGAPDARLILDPNEGWTLPILVGMADAVSRAKVAMVEQPLPAEADAELAGLAYPAPICADESAHTADDVARVADRYQMVNVKLDKAGGLTGALEMVARAHDLGLGVLAGCMVCSSLAIAPALWVGALADACDLDGPWWLAQDREGGVCVDAGRVFAPEPGFWG